MSGGVPMDSASPSMAGKLGQGRRRVGRLVGEGDKEVVGIVGTLRHVVRAEGMG